MIVWNSKSNRCYNTRRRKNDLKDLHKNKTLSKVCKVIIPGQRLAVWLITDNDVTHNRRLLCLMFRCCTPLRVYISVLVQWTGRRCARWLVHWRATSYMNLQATPTESQLSTWLPDYLFTARRVHAAAAAAVHGLEMLTLVYPHHCAAASGNSIACICISPSRGGGSKEPAATHANARTLWWNSD